jgi:hypothetical protein
MGRQRVREREKIMHARMLILLPSEAKGDYRSAFFTPNPIAIGNVSAWGYLSERARAFNLQT